MGGGVKFGMIRLGFPSVSIYSNDGIMWENRGKVIFNGPCMIGNNSKISIGEKGQLTLGIGFSASCSLKCICYNRVTIDSGVLVGWDCLISDTDFHTLHTENGKTKGYGEIYIGHESWIAMQSLILKGAKIPPYSVCAARSMINKDFTDEKGKFLIAGQPSKVVGHNIYRDRNDDNIDYIQE